MRALIFLSLFFLFLHNSFANEPLKNVSKISFDYEKRITLVHELIITINKNPSLEFGCPKTPTTLNSNTLISKKHGLQENTPIDELLVFLDVFNECSFMSK